MKRLFLLIIILASCDKNKNQEHDLGEHSENRVNYIWTGQEQIMQWVPVSVVWYKQSPPPFNVWQPHKAFSQTDEVAMRTIFLRLVKPEEKKSRPNMKTRDKLSLIFYDGSPKNLTVREVYFKIIDNAFLGPTGKSVEIARILLGQREVSSLFYAPWRCHVGPGRDNFEEILRTMEVNLKFSGRQRQEIVDPEIPLLPVIMYPSVKSLNPQLRLEAVQPITPLAMAAYNGMVDDTKKLLDNGDQVDARSANGYTALMLAAYGGHISITQLLLDHGANANLQANDGSTALRLAAGMGHVEETRLLLDHGAQVNAKDIRDSTTALMLAAYNGHVDVTKLLLGHGAEIDAKYGTGATALILATHGGHANIVSLLLERGAEINVVDMNDATALMIAAQNGYVEMIKLLLEKGADIHKKTKNGMTALHIAAKNGQLETARILLEKGADIEIKNYDGATALWIAADNGFMEILQFLLERGAAVDAKDNDGVTGLWRAAGKGYIDVVQLLIDKGADINTINPTNGISVFLNAVWNSEDEELIKLLLEKGANINTANDYGVTPLWIAASIGYRDIVQLLLNRGADIHAKVSDTNGDISVLDIARQHGDREIVQLLEKAVAKQ